MRRFIEDEFMLPVEFAELPKDVELLVAQEMIKVVDRMFQIGEQESFVKKMQMYRINLRTMKPE